MASYKPIPSFDEARAARFWAKVNKTDGCWLWTATIDRGGYGRFRLFRAHRIAYALTHGSVPDGLTIDHLCRNRACVNPAHLEPVTKAVNTMRGKSDAALNATKTHCVRGHAFSVENTYVNAQGHRTCRACRPDRPGRFNSKELRAARRCVRCHKPSETFRCADCRKKHNDACRRYR